VARSPTSADAPSGSTATAPTGFRQVATTCGSGSAHGDGGCGTPVCPAPPPCGGCWGGAGVGTTGGPPSSPAPSSFSCQSRGPESGNVAHPATSRPSAAAATNRLTRPTTPPG
jgi:hypothetical protein